MSIPLERFFQQPPINGRPLADVEWRPNGRQFTFLEPTVGASDSAQPPLDLWAHHLETGARDLLLHGGDLRSEGEPISLRSYQWFPDGGRLLVTARGTAWECRLADGSLQPLLSAFDDRVPPCFSPGGDQLGFVRDNNLWVRSLLTGVERALTSDGSETLLNGVLDWAYWEELGNRASWRAFEWSPDGTQIAYLQLDQSRVPEYPLVDLTARHPQVTRQRYPKAGDPNSLASVRLVDVESGRGTAEHQELSEPTYIAPFLTWTPDSSALAYVRIPRDQKSLELRLLVPAGESRTLLTEADPHWVNRIGPPTFLPTGELLWVSERTGRAHLYRHAASGAPLHAVTEGAWQVEAVHGVDDRYVYLSGTGLDPRERHLYRALLDGTGVERLTPDDGLHRCSLRKDCAWALITRQTPSAPPETTLLHTGRKEQATVRRADPEVERHQWPAAEMVEVTAVDGSTLYGRLLLPLGFDPSRRYPVLVHVYGGPHAQTVQKIWAGCDPLEQLLARVGIICWRLDNRGSWGRGHAFETPVDRRLGEIELQDQLTGVEYLRSLPYVDPERIGISGWSYGGYLTLYAMTQEPKIWRCGAAGAPVTDWSLYDSIYTERYMGTPDENPGGYRASSPIHAVEGLNAPLLLVHGTDDDNVHLQHTVQFVEALSRHRKPYELLIQPKQTHGFKGEGPEIYLHERMLEFFRRHLCDGE